MDTVENMVPSTEEEEKLEEEIKEDVEEELIDGKEDEEQECGDEQAEEAMPQTGKQIEKTIPLPVKPREKKQDDGLNLNNEVVKMRKEVKRVRALIIRKLTRQIGALKKKKGKDVEVERNQRRAARLLEEIHAMKVLSPDLVTKTALQKIINFEQACKNPKSTISDRATARIATHPQFSKKIEDIKKAVKAFKEERMKAGKQGGKEKVQNKAGKGTPQSPVKMVERKSEKDEEDITVQQKEIIEDEKSDGSLKGTKAVAEPEQETSPTADTTDDQTKENPEAENVRPAATKSSDIKDVVKNKPQSQHAERKPNLESPHKVLQQKKDEVESDLEASDDEEKEYFDDSTEERFHKQSSQSEESDDDGGFFVGKVSKFKKKKKKQQQQSEEGGKAGKGWEVSSSDQVQSELNELESRLKSKATSFQSVFCSSLSSSKPGGGRGTGRGRGGDRFRGQGKPKGGSGPDREFGKQSKFQKLEKGISSFGKGRGRGRGDVIRQNGRGGGGVFTHKAPEQALHPSWEASKKRKEQQGQILAFQGKKIKFDLDD